jgi:hypothetical protein
MAFVVGCVVGSCCNEVSVSLASRRKARRANVWMEDDEPFGASKAVRSAAAVLISCWMMFGAVFTRLWELGVHGGRVAARGWRPFLLPFRRRRQHYLYHRRVHGVASMRMMPSSTLGGCFDVFVIFFLLDWVRLTGLID